MSNGARPEMVEQPGDFPADDVHQHDSLRAAVAFAAEAMLRADHWRSNMRSILARLGEATGSSRVHLLHCEGGHPDGAIASLESEWVAAGVSTQIDNPALQGFRWRDFSLERWERLLASNEIVCGVREEFPARERDALDGQDILSIILVPIFAGAQWWGVIGFDDCRDRRIWSAGEIDALRTAAWIIGAIVDRDNATVALVRNRALLRDFAEAASDSFWETDNRHRFIRFEGSREETTFGRLSAYVGRHPWDLPGIEGGNQARQALFDLFRRREAFRNVRLSLTDSNGFRRHLALSGKPRFDQHGTFRGFRGSGADVTAEVAARRQAEGLRHTLETAIASISDGFALYDRDLRLVTCNARLLEMVGSDRDLFVPGARYEDILRARIARGSIRSAQGNEDAYIRKRLQQRRDRTGESENEWFDGRWIRVNERRMPDGGVVVLASDITLLKRREAELRAAKEEAERLHLAKSKFLAAASHDLRQPLHALGLLLAALAKSVRGRRARTIIGSMERSLAAMQAMFHAVLDISKLDAGVMTPEVKAFPIDDLLGRLIEEFKAEAAEKSLKLRYLSSRAAIVSDRALLERVLRNLIANAIRYTARGGLLVGCRRRGTELSIEVWDTGIGIPADQIDAIFDEFHQVSAESSSEHQGLGLGLAIVSRITRLLGHRISVRSVPGRGSVFGVSVPLAIGSAVSERRGNVRTLRPPAFAATVLVIDDDPAILAGMREALESWGCVALLAQSVAEARGLLAVEAPDVIIADYRLQEGTTGIEALDDLTRRDDGAIAGVLVTGDTAPDRLKEARASGYHLLHKPVQPARLRALLGYLVDRGAPAGSRARLS